MKSSQYLSRRRDTAVHPTAQARFDPSNVVVRDYMRADAKLGRGFKSETNLRELGGSWNINPWDGVAEKDCDRSRVLEVVINPSSADLLKTLEMGGQQKKKVGGLYQSELLHKRQSARSGKQAREEYNTKLKMRLEEKIRRAQEKLAQMDQCYRERKEEKRIILESKLVQSESLKSAAVRTMASF